MARSHSRGLGWEQQRVPSQFLILALFAHHQSPVSACRQQGVWGFPGARNFFFGGGGGGGNINNLFLYVLSYVSTPMSITILSFFRLFLRRQYNYVLTCQKQASDWLKISRRFRRAPTIQNRNSKFLFKRRPEM